MIAGNFLTRLFDNTSKQIDLENSVMKFTVQADYETSAKTVESYFTLSTRDPRYTYTGNGVVTFI
jgi:hypothetical protein